MATTPHPEFQAYLESISTDEKYTRWWNRYTLTDTVGKQREQCQFSPFDFGLMVHVQPNQAERIVSQEKLERLSVLEGIP